MKNSQKIKFSFLVLLIMTGLMFIFTDDKEQGEILLEVPSAEVPKDSSSKPSFDQTTTPAVREDRTSRRKSFQKNQSESIQSRIEIEKQLETLSEKSTQSKKEFMQSAKFKLSFPDNYHYNLSESEEEDLLVLSGFDSENESYFTVVAGRQLYSNEEALQYIKAEPESADIPKEYWPATKNLQFYQKLEDDSFRNNEIMFYYGSAGNKGVVVVYGTRKDEKGSYMMTLSGSTQFLEKNEDFFTNVLVNGELTP